MRQPSLSHRALGAIMDVYTQIQMGYPLPFAAELLDTHGLAGFGDWANETAHARARAHERWGFVPGETLVSLAAAWTGCGWCSRGHLRAANLAYLKDTDSLYALNEVDMPGWQQLRDSEFAEAVTTALLGQGHHATACLVQRMFDLRAGTDPTDDNDVMLERLMASWDLLAECSIGVDLPQEVPALEPDLVRDAALNNRYRRLRSA